MYLRSLVLCIYLMGAYWASTHFPSLKMVFYPTLGAFGFLFMQRTADVKSIRRITFGAMIAVWIGSSFYFISSGIGSLFVTAMVTLSLIHLFKWNAAPILAVSLIPFFAHPAAIWEVPLAVLASLFGLVFPLWMIGKLEALFQKVPAMDDRMLQAKQETQ